jgi:glycosyltransferase involved in cell wall biosynthesis
MTARSILFISHSAGRTGAPMVLLNFIRWFKAHSTLPFQILLREGGELESEFGLLAAVTMPNAVLRRAFRNVPHPPGFDALLAELDRRVLRRQLAPGSVGLVYSNTVTNGAFLDALTYLDCPVVSHVHELEHWIRDQVGLEMFKLTKRKTHRYIAVSQAVKDNLVNTHAIPDSRIDLVYGFIAVQPAKLINRQIARQYIFSQLGIPQEGLLVGASGTTDWRKSPDLFIELARSIHHMLPMLQVHFVWVGGRNSGLGFHKLRHLMKSFGVSDSVHFVGTQPRPLDYFAALDVFALTSREDPFPLVMLEAASVGNPIVCFDGSGGAKEFVAEDCGFAVPYLDVEAMATRVVDMLQSPDLRNRMGGRAKEKVQAQHDISVVAPQLMEIIQRCYQR